MNTLLFYNGLTIYEARDELMNYEDAIKWIHSREKFKIKPGLKRMEWMMDRLSNPETKLNSIHIAGTNGKGSTVSFLRSLLQTQGYSVGTFTSPYIIRFNERMSINGEAISDYELADLVGIVKPLAEKLAKTEWGEPTEFEVITVMSIIHFSNKNVDFAIFETGIGGRYDSTNVIQPLASVITNIGKDHMAMLGDTYEDIASEKAGIIKKDTPIFTCVKQKEAMDVIEEEAKRKNAPLYRADFDFSTTYLRTSEKGEEFEFQMGNYCSPRLLSQMKGTHQVANASLAIATIEHLRRSGFLIQKSFYSEAIEKTTWPARFETVQSRPRVILDGAHNEEGTLALLDTIKRYFPGKSIYLLYAAVEGKPVTKMLHTLQPLVKEAWFTQFTFPKALLAKDLYGLSMIQPSYYESDYKQALLEISKKMTEEDVLVISGSLYFISDIRKFFE
ncbi:bifunctional folylpolyglutamate synthase/dihydrofolate synthase [Halobacillus seohaensis]|uniref:tetrahydrofolate synthase n=1 Tax=Halobacillus seohaensis TaxID=447421 RepID=A0ABW2EHK4_9BACI